MVRIYFPFFLPCKVFKTLKKIKDQEKKKVSPWLLESNLMILCIFGITDHTWKLVFRGKKFPHKCKKVSTEITAIVE